MICIGGPVWADTLRIATYNTELERKGPGLLLRDIARGEDDQIAAVQAVIRHNNPDILVVQGFDYDLTNAALTAFAGSLSYPHYFALRPNTGLDTGFDMDGNGRLGEARDAQGYGTFSGQGGMAILSRHPIITDQVQDFSALLWLDFAGALLSDTDGPMFPSADARAAQRLSTTGHWIVPIDTPNGPIDILAFHATPPVFDGPEDRNGKRNHDEIMFWVQALNGAIGTLNPDFVIAGDANLDPTRGQGIKAAIRTLLQHPRQQDPMPYTPATVDWTDPVPGDLRVDYVLPSVTLTVTDSGVYWPAAGDPMAEIAKTASRHHLVWVDLER